MGIVQLRLFDGKDCPSCKQFKPTGDFYKNRQNRDGLTSYCGACLRERACQWHKQNSARKVSYNRQYLSQHPEYKTTNRYRERLRRNGRLRRQRYPEFNRLYARRYQNRKRNSVGSHTLVEWNTLCEKYEHRCLCCGAHVPMTADHITPLSHGGSDYIDNIQPLCRSCNSVKGTKHTDYRPAELT